MAKQTKRERRTHAKRQEAAVKLLGLGLAFILLPLFTGKSLIGQAFSGLRWPGFLLMLVGGVLLWLSRKSSDTSQAGMAEPTHRRQSTQSTQWRAPEYSESERQEPHLDETLRDGEANAPAKPEAWGPRVFDLIEWRRFEAVIERLFQQAGFETKSKSHGADDGVDVWLYSRNHGDRPVSVVQCKHWNGKQVGVDKIRELRGVMAAFDIPRGQYATTSTYSDAAREFAQANNINLLDVNGLLALIAKRTPEQQAELLEVALDGDYCRPTCVNCGVKMVKRRPRNSGKPFWGCPNFPRCQTVMKMRGV